jgi:hypothetical protein
MTESIHIKKRSDIPPGRCISNAQTRRNCMSKTRRTVMAAIAGTPALARPASRRADLPEKL